MKLEPMTLGEAIHVKHGFAFKGEYFASEGEQIVLTPGNFYEAGGFRVRPGKDRFYAGDVPDDFVLKQGDLIVAMTEQGPGLLGSSARIPEDFRFLHNQRIGLVDRIDERKLHKGFLYHLFNTKEVRGQISGSATGTKVRHTAPERIYRVRVQVPDVDVQKAIAETLDRYEELVTNNKRRIELLEQSAQLLFKEWFVHLRYPGHEHDKFVDGVPEGWERKAITELISFISRGITPKYDDDATGWVINQKCIRDRLLDMAPARRQSKTPPDEKLVRAGDVLVNSTGEGTLGRVAQVFDDLEHTTVDSHVTIVRARDQRDAIFLGLHLTGMEAYLASQGRGATNQKELSRATIGEIQLVVPPERLRLDLADAVSPHYRQILILKRQCRALARARDLLLPRLMDGRISV